MGTPTIATMSNDTQQTAKPETPAVLINGIDRSIEGHLAWNHRLLHCALLRESPGDEVLHPDAASLCQFAQWLSIHQKQLETFDAVLFTGITLAHRDVHDAVRTICNQVLRGHAAAASDLQAYEQGQGTMVALLNELRERIAEVESHRDLLTGLPLRNGLEYAFGLRQRDARRGNSQLWLAMIDVDHFKAVNDQYGHFVGDVTLQHIARRLMGCLRDTDALFRYGGEEFLGLFVVRDLAGVEVLANRMLGAVSTPPLTTTSGITLQPTVTVGLALVGFDEDLASVTECADQAMLLGKAQGRNRYVLAVDRD